MRPESRQFAFLQTAAGQSVTSQNINTPLIQYSYTTILSKTRFVITEATQL